MAESPFLTDESVAFLDFISQAKAPKLAEQSPQLAREASEKFSAFLKGDYDYKSSDQVLVTDLAIPVQGVSVPVRTFVPKIRTTRTLLVYFHGGGWALNSASSPHFSAVCSLLAKDGGFSIASVDYSLAPECKFPGPVLECVECTKWLLSAENRVSLGLPFNIEAVGVCGDSSGGNIAAVTVHELKKMRITDLKFQVLIYPATNLHAAFPSHEKFAQGYFLTREKMDWTVSQYLSSKSDKDDPRASPLFYKDFSSLPPCLVLAGDCDPLVDESVAYAKKMLDAGNLVQCVVEKGLIHAYFTYLRFFPKASAASRIKIIDFVKEHSV